MKRPLTEVLEVEVPLAAVLASKTMTLGQVLAFAPGAVIDLGKSVAAPLSLTLNGRPLAAGAAVRVGDRYGFRVMEIADAASVVQKLGG
jgi:flagellar motor switch/type III secretory pathway protein FliN